MTARLHALLPPDSVRRVRLPNGLTILARRDTTAPVVAIVTWVKAGYFDETDDVVGIAHVLEHMYFKGTPTRGVGEIARETKAAGGYLNAGTIYDHTHYYTVLPASGFVAGLEVQADAYANSVIDAGELARELEVIIEETKRKADTASALAGESLFELLHDRHRIRRWRMGREHALRGFTRRQVADFYRDFYRPSNTVLAIVGDIDPDTAIAHATRLYGPIADAPVVRSPGPVEEAPSGFRVRDWEGDIAQAELVFGWRTPALAHADTPALDVLATVLSGGRASRLVRAARDRRLVSSVSAYDYTPTELGVFVVHATARADDLPAAARALWDQLRRVRAGEVTAGEVERARCLLEAQWLRRLESADGQANFLGAWELLGAWDRGVAYHEAVFDVDAARITEVAARWLDPDQAAIVTYRPRGTTALGADAAAVRRALESERPAPLDATAAPAPVASPAPMRARFERVVDGIHQFRTANGVPILVRHRPGASLTHLGCFVGGGVMQESEHEGGISTLMARAMLRGTTSRSASRLAEDAELLGGVPSANVGTETMQWAVGVPARQFGAAAELLSDLVLSPVFPEDGVEAERAVALAALAALRDDMYRQPMRLAAGAAWPGHPYGRSTIGTEESIRAVSRDAIARWHAARVPASAAVLVAVGDLDPQQAADTLASRFAALRYAPLPDLPAPPWPAVSLVRAEEREKAQTALSLLFDGPSYGEAARFDAEMLSGVASGLGGRFFEELRDRQSLAYTVMARPFVRRNGGTFGAYIATSPEKEEQARASLLREFARFVEEEVTPQELDRARRYAIGAWQIRQASGASVLAEIADAWINGALEDIARYPEDLGAVTPARMRAAAARWFDPDRRVEGIVRGRNGAAAR
ncbi:MAG: insulinase family protein [Gemmatimonadetes bacterium]|nr:insulinase family protein [Gemmatimonadota bacterium]